jgi:hypothetical protein
MSVGSAATTKSRPRKSLKQRLFDDAETSQSQTFFGKHLWIPSNCNLPTSMSSALKQIAQYFDQQTIAGASCLLLKSRWRGKQQSQQNEKSESTSLFEAIFIPLLRKRSTVSLRLLNWLCINFSKENLIVLEKKKQQPADEKADLTKHINLFEEYNRQLNIHGGSAFFDSCRRLDVKKNKYAIFFYVDGDGEIAEVLDTNDDRKKKKNKDTSAERIEESKKKKIDYTTIAQLNYIRWCYESGVIAYAETHRKIIEAHMNACYTKSLQEKTECKQRGQKRRRKPLSTHFRVPKKHKITRRRNFAATADTDTSCSSSTASSSSSSVLNTPFNCFTLYRNPGVLNFDSGA